MVNVGDATKLLRFAGVMGVCVGLAWIGQVVLFEEGSTALNLALWVVGAASIAGAGAGAICSAYILQNGVLALDDLWDLFETTRKSARCQTSDISASEQESSQSAVSCRQLPWPTHTAIEDQTLRHPIEGIGQQKFLLGMTAAQV